MPPEVVAAYRYCEAVTGIQARNFAYGIKLLPPAQRRAMSAVYALARRVDDIGDGTLDNDTKFARLGEVRTLIERVDERAVRPEDTDPVAVALQHAARRFPIPMEAFGELVDGVEMDVRGQEYETYEELKLYCRCVAGSIGRLSLGVFGCSDPKKGPELADTLGLALQLTNIMRDVREDALNGRTYLPREELEQFGCEAGFAGPLPAGADFNGLMSFQARRAQALFDEGLKLLPMLDWRSSACVSAMAGIYHRLLARIAADPRSVLRGRVSLPPWEKASVAVKGLTGRRT
ncbi:presqualene diphosphate synthase HpnD [Streptomyces gilvigriseus]|uniref:presqualene diphosphate synthase HpnD n=1 Tax=Mangrovactinospora gilvigrisea TaxID=1428644 RepID=UPI000D1991C6